MPATLVQCRTSFSGPDFISVKEGELLYSDDPIVKKWPEFFGPPKTRGNRQPPIEQATAAPGEKRGA